MGKIKSENVGEKSNICERFKWNNKGENFDIPRSLKLKKIKRKSLNASLWIYGRS